MFQARYDRALEPWGQRAPAPTFGQDPQEYRRDMAAQTKRLLPSGHELRKVKYWDLRNDAFEALEPDLLRAVSEHGQRNDSVPYTSPLRQVTEIDGNGMKIVKFVGQRHFVNDFKSPVRYVTSFTTDHGKWMPQRGWFA